MPRLDAQARDQRGIVSRDRARAKLMVRRCEAAARQATQALRKARVAVDRAGRAERRVEGMESDKAIKVEAAAYAARSHHRNAEQLQRRTQGAVRHVNPVRAEQFACQCERAATDAVSAARAAEKLSR